MTEQQKTKKCGLIGSVRLVCRDKDGNIKWTEDVTDEQVVRQKQ